jgi:hypothetical protein
MIPGKGKSQHGRFAMRPEARLIGSLVLLLGVGGVCAQGTAVSAADRAAVKSVLTQYRDAIAAKNGEAVFNLLDAKTISWYEDAIKDAVTLSKADLAKRDYLNKLTVLRLRHEMARPELEKKTGKDVIVDGVKNGWIGGSFADMIVIQFVGKDKNGVTYVTLQQNPKVPAFYFANEDGKWKLALSQGFGIAQKGFEQMQVKSGMSADDFLCKMLEDATRKKVDRKIFDGPRDKDEKDK